MLKCVLMIGLILSVSACTTVYEVSPQMMQGVQIETLVVEGEESQSIQKSQIVIEPLKLVMSQFEQPRFVVTIRNLSQKPLGFSTDNISVMLNGKPGRVLSYAMQLEEIKARLFRYDRRMTIAFKQNSSDRFLVNADFDQLMDSLDVQTALADLQYLNRTALKPKLLAPGEQYSGEITLANKLSAHKTQHLMMTVSLGGESQEFSFTYTVKH